MVNKFKFKLVILFWLSFIFLFSKPINAQTNSELFDTKLKTTVTVNNSGQSRIKHEFTITNKTPTTFVSQYGLKVSSPNLDDITVISNGRSIKPITNKIKSGPNGGPGITSIGITFDDKVVGEGKSRQLIISYTHPDAVTINGSVMEVALPPQANPEDYSSYTTTLITPAIFGGPVRTTPDKHTYTANGSQIVTMFEGGAAEGIFALFGQKQIYQLELEYQLENSSNNSGITQIALPPDTPYQKMNYELLSPLPQKMELDADKNWIATYTVPASQTLSVKVQAQALLSLDPNDQVPTAIPNDKHLQADDFWQVDHSKFKSVLTNLKNAADVNEFVVNHLNYNTQRALNSAERLGALAILDQPENAVCQEYTDLFITLARSLDIPSRRLTGYAQSQNNELRPLSLVEDILHAWPEYFDDTTQTWIPIDPTWEDTTGGVDYFGQRDLNHLVFAINGLDSATPYPAGSYKTINSTQKLVNVTFATAFDEPAPTVNLAVKPQKFFGINIFGSYQLEITNLSGQASYDLSLNNKTQASQLLQLPAEIDSLLPFQTLKLPFKIIHHTSILPKHDTITLKINDQTYTQDIITGPNFGTCLQQPLCLAGLAGGVIFITISAGSLLVLKRKKSGSLRRKS